MRLPVDAVDATVHLTASIFGLGLGSITCVCSSVCFVEKIHTTSHHHQTYSSFGMTFLVGPPYPYSLVQLGLALHDAHR